MPEDFNKESTTENNEPKTLEQQDLEKHIRALESADTEEAVRAASDMEYLIQTARHIKDDTYNEFADEYTEKEKEVLWNTVLTEVVPTLQSVIDGNDTEDDLINKSVLAMREVPAFNMEKVDVDRMVDNNEHLSEEYLHQYAERNDQDYHTLRRFALEWAIIRSAGGKRKKERSYSPGGINRGPGEKSGTYIEPSATTTYYYYDPDGNWTGFLFSEWQECVSDIVAEYKKEQENNKEPASENETPAEKFSGEKILSKEKVEGEFDFKVTGFNDLDFWVDVINTDGTMVLESGETFLDPDNKNKEGDAHTPMHIFDPRLMPKDTTTWDGYCQWIKNREQLLLENLEAKTNIAQNEKNEYYRQKRMDKVPLEWGEFIAKLNNIPASYFKIPTPPQNREIEVLATVDKNGYLYDLEGVEVLNGSRQHAHISDESMRGSRKGYDEINQAKKKHEVMKQYDEFIHADNTQHETKQHEKPTSPEDENIQSEINAIQENIDNLIAESSPEGEKPWLQYNSPHNLNTLHKEAQEASEIASQYTSDAKKMLEDLQQKMEEVHEVDALYLETQNMVNEKIREVLITGAGLDLSPDTHLYDLLFENVYIQNTTRERINFAKYVPDVNGNKYAVAAELIAKAGADRTYRVAQIVVRDDGLIRLVDYTTNNIKNNDHKLRDPRNGLHDEGDTMMRWIGDPLDPDSFTVKNYDIAPIPKPQTPSKRRGRQRIPRQRMPRKEGDDDATNVLKPQTSVGSDNNKNALQAALQKALNDNKDNT